MCVGGWGLYYYLFGLQMMQVFTDFTLLKSAIFCWVGYLFAKWGLEGGGYIFLSAEVYRSSCVY